MKNKIYTVHAYRWGDRELHSYSVGVFMKKQQAILAAEEEADYRGGKYECEILEWLVDRSTKGRDNESKIIKALPKVNTLKDRGS
jgi:hypothetical protein